MKRGGIEHPKTRHLKTGAVTAKQNRPTIRPIVRFEIFKRDDFRCQYCGQSPPQTILEIDHIIAVSAGGSDDELNLITACITCNRGKAARSLRDIPASLKARIEEETERAEQIRQFNALLDARRLSEDTIIEKLGVGWCDRVWPDKIGQRTFSYERARSVRKFLQSLPTADVQFAIDEAFGRMPPYGTNDDRTFRYFCGICWRLIRGDA